MRSKPIPQSHYSPVASSKLQTGTQISERENSHLNKIGIFLVGLMEVRKKSRLLRKKKAAFLANGLFSGVAF